MKYFAHPTEPIDVKPDKQIKELAREMMGIGYQGRKLGESINIWGMMLKKRGIVIWLGLAGAMVPAGMRKLIAYLIRRRMVDVIVSTGANLYHDFCEAMNIKHYLGTHLIDDVRLRQKRVDRIYDIFANENKYYELDRIIEKKFANVYLKENYNYSSREVLSELGKFLSENSKDKKSIIETAYKSGVPIFSPAISDSSLGFSIMFCSRRSGKNIIINNLKEADETSRITEKSKYVGAIFVGGGYPKNFIQQTAVIASYQTKHDRSLSFAIQISTDSPQWGGLSGATFQEAQSWGKYRKGAKMVQCYADATIVLPIIVHALSEEFKKLRRSIPTFEWNNKNLTINYRNVVL